MERKISTLCVAVAFLVFASMAFATDRLVPSDYPTIQSAVDAAVNGDTVVVAPITYTGPGNCDIDFLGKAITVRSTDPNDPCIIAETIIDCQEDTINKHRGFKFVTGEDANSILRGITIIDGNAPFENIFGDVNTYGGAIFCYGGSPTITNCIMKNNSASRGGAIYCGLSAAIIKDCVFMNNTASFHGGAILCRHSQAIIDNSFFQYNTAASHGGAIYCKEGNEIIKDCNVLSNRGLFGGGIYSNSVTTIQDCIINYNQGLNGGGLDFAFFSDSVITNCIISGNMPIEAGSGGIQVHEGARARITNCTITKNNSFARGGAIRVVFNSIAIVENCIIWGNNGGQLCANSSPASLILIYNDIEGGIENISLEFGGSVGLEVGNIDIDPCFADPCNGDYHLLLESPCVNTGDPNYAPEPNETDLDGKPRIIGSRVDMGAYEFNHIPVADAGPNQTIEAQAPWGATVHLDGSNSSDADSSPGTNDDIVSFEWFKQIDPCDPNTDIFLGSGQVLDCNLPLGTHTIILEVTDKAGASDTDETIITVQDTTPPVFTLSVTPTTLWPPNKKMIKIIPACTVSDLCDTQPDVSLKTIQITESGQLIGTYPPNSSDILIDPNGSISLRAWCSGNSAYRCYTVTYQAVDDANNTAQGSAAVIVPHDQRKSK